MGMKIRLLCRKEMINEVVDSIQTGKIEFDNDANFVLYEINHEYDYILVKDQNEYIRLAVEEIIYIESVGKGIIVHTKNHQYNTKDTMYQLEANLYNKGFLRIHKAYIVNKKAIKRIRTGLYMKFTLVLQNNVEIEVSRSYYYRFKEEMGF